MTALVGLNSDSYTSIRASQTVAPSGASAVATPEVSAPTSIWAVSISLSPNAQRLQAAEANLATLQAGASLKGVWDADVKASLLGLNTEGPADTQVSNLPPSDKDHITQAQQAQSYVKAKISSGGSQISAPNPFSGLSYASLAAVVSDKSGLYTDYEKSAAFYAFNDKQNAWVVPLSQQAAQTGNYSGFYQEGVKQYNSLPPLIQATYPPGYLRTITEYANGSLDNRGPQIATNDDHQAYTDPVLALFSTMSKLQSDIALPGKQASPAS